MKSRGKADTEPATPPRKIGPRQAAGIAALFCLLAALWFLLSALLIGGLPPEFVLFAVLAVVFGALWWSLRTR